MTGNEGRGGGKVHSMRGNRWQDALPAANQCKPLDLIFSSTTSRFLRKMSTEPHCTKQTISRLEVVSLYQQVSDFATVIKWFWFYPNPHATQVVRRWWKWINGIVTELVLEAWSRASATWLTVRIWRRLRSLVRLSITGQLHLLHHTRTSTITWFHPPTTIVVSPQPFLYQSRALQPVKRLGILCFLCPCDETQPMSHVIESCPHTKRNCGLSQLHSAAIAWLTNYRS